MARRALQAGAGVILAASVAGLRGMPLPFTGEEPPYGLGIEGSESPRAVAGALWHALSQYPAVGIEAGVFAAAAALLPVARRYGLAGSASTACRSSSLRLPGRRSSALARSNPSPSSSARSSSAPSLQRRRFAAPWSRGDGQRPTMKRAERASRHRAPNRVPLRGNLRPCLPVARPACRDRTEARQGDGRPPLRPISRIYVPNEYALYL